MLSGDPIHPPDNCLVCGGALFAPPLLRYKNMPAAAQGFPDAGSLDSDRGADLEVRQCCGCGLVQLGNAPVPYYRDVIRAAAVSEEMRSFRTEQFGHFAERFSLRGKKVLEIGCGRGEFLSILRGCGMDAHGLEHSEAATAECLRAGLPVSRGFVDAPDYWLPDAPFDAFFILQFLEHLPAPNVVLQGIANLLVDEGVGLVEVPNFDLILRKNLFSEFIADHLFYFTPETLRTTLTLNGFEVLECGEVWHDYILSAVVRKRSRLDLSHFHQSQARLKAELHQYLDRFPPGSVAVWGAGHQALAILALTDLADRIKYVVDSAPFKQGKYTPATHLRIVAPDMLNTEPVEAVIVMAASYSGEVAGMLRQNWGGRLAVATLDDFESLGPSAH